MNRKYLNNHFLTLVSCVITLVSTLCANDDFSQCAPIDTTCTMIVNSPFYSEKEALNQHNLMEQKIVQKTLSDSDGFYLLFRYRESSMIPLWQERLSHVPRNVLFKLWYIDAISQIGDTNNLSLIAPYLSSENDMIRESAANAYGFLAPKDSIPSIEKQIAQEKNGYVRETLKASLRAIKSGGYKNSVSYLPVYYDCSPKKMVFFYNQSVSSGSNYYYENHADSNDHKPYPITSNLIFPTQQFIYKIKNGPKAGTFANKHGNMYHIGIDNGWLFEGVPVHSISNGIVKHVSHDLSWGNVVAIESYLPTNDTITIIYGHLSRFIPVSVGDVIYQGERIGQIGNSVSYDNGGYWAHLHLGIAKGAYAPDKIRGYSTDTTRFENPITLISKWTK